MQGPLNVKTILLLQKKHYFKCNTILHLSTTGIIYPTEREIG